MDTRKGKTYLSPEVETMSIQVRDVIAGSTDNIDISNPWIGIGEEEL